ncbi:MAG: universal stress protein [Leptolyngbyaceae cyanobacterium MO_188.B28]|nr:universal stress protein [Leptolyngbyaceae cyanobacterium MO_188.B28]
MFEKILVAMDKSDLSQCAFEKAVSLAKVLNAKLMLLHVLSSDDEDSPQMNTLYGEGYYTELDEILRDRYEREWNEFAHDYLSLLEGWVKQAVTAGVDAECTQPCGNPNRTICDLAKAWEADLIVMGSHGRKGFSELLLGSVSNYVMHHAPCSVLIVHPQEALRTSTPQKKKAAAVSHQHASEENIFSGKESVGH